MKTPGIPRTGLTPVASAVAAFLGWAYPGTAAGEVELWPLPIPCVNRKAPK